MINTKMTAFLIAAVLASSALLLSPTTALAHCDGLDGPVVTAARKALETGNVKPVLIWVQKTDEPEITAAFQKTLAVRKLNPQAKDLADTYFFETLYEAAKGPVGEHSHEANAASAHGDQHK